MKVRLRFLFSILIFLFALVCVKAQSSVSEVYFQEEDTIDIYADESTTIVSRIDAPYHDSIHWVINLSGNAVYYLDDVSKIEDFTFTPPNPSIASVEKYELSVQIQKMLVNETKCLLDTTKVYCIRVFPKPYTNVIVRFCEDYDDDNGYLAYSLVNKKDQPDNKFHFTSYSSHVLRVSIPAVSDPVNLWSWEIGGTTLDAGVGPAYKYRFKESDATEDGNVMPFSLVVRNKLPHRKEAYVEEYEFDCKVYPEPIAEVCEYIDTYSGRPFSFGLTYYGGIKDKWDVEWSDLNKNIYTEEEMQNVCHYVDTPTQFLYRIEIVNGSSTFGYYGGVAYPIAKVWTKPEANFIDIANKAVLLDSISVTAYDVFCSENESLSVRFSTKGGYEPSTCWEGNISDDISYTDNGIVVCNHIVSVSDSLRATAVDGICEFPVYAYIKNIYDGKHSSPDSIWYCDSVLLNLKVALSVQKPLQLVKKGNGNSGTLIAVVNDSGDYTDKSNYCLVYGYEDKDGNVVKEHSPKKYNSSGSHKFDVFDKEELSNTEYRFFVYAVLSNKYNIVMKSDKCYMEHDEQDEEVPEIGSYDALGRMIPFGARGVTIIRYSDGTAKKVINL